VGALLAFCPQALRAQKALLRQWKELPLTELTRSRRVVSSHSLV
jgi:hypothetical protein